MDRHIVISTHASEDDARWAAHEWLRLNRSAEWMVYLQGIDGAWEVVKKPVKVAP